MSSEKVDGGARPAQPLQDDRMACRLRELGHRVAELRRSAGFTQVELAERSAVHFITISRLERGTQNVSVAVVWKLAHALDVDASDLLK